MVETAETRLDKMGGKESRRMGSQDYGKSSDQGGIFVQQSH